MTERNNEIADKFSPDQKVALEKVDAWLKGKDPKFFSLFGCAGTGKTTLARFLTENVSGAVYFAAFTGKAAQVLRQAGIKDARTIHSLIYIPQDKSPAKLREIEAALADFPQEDTWGDDRDMYEAELADLQEKLRIEKLNADRPMFKLNCESELRYASLCVIDECSMIDKQIGEDLMSFGIPILALGDPGQLPPIHGGGYFTDRKPDHLLTEVHRQARDSPIIKMATAVRMGKTLEYGDYGQGCRVVEKSTPEMALAADQIIVGRNATRKWINERVRELLGRESPDPVPGDKLVCLRNNKEAGLLNGGLWTTVSCDAADDIAFLTVTPFQDKGKKVSCIAHTHYWQGRDNDLAWYEKKESQEFDFGYAITGHKSQGSQWGNVLIIDESRVFKQDANRWLYTAITRACKSVIVVRYP